MTKKKQSPSNDKLKLRRIAIDTYRENVAYMHRECDIYRAEGFQALTKVEIRSNGQHIFAVLNVVDDESIVGLHELGLSEQAFEQLGLPAGHSITVAQAELPPSMDAVRRKIAGERLYYQDFSDITRDLVNNRYSKMEMAAFLVASGQTGLDREEILHLTRAMLESGDRLEWPEVLIADKHCIGGIPGNRTSMLVVPIVAAHGMMMPKTSSRAITSPAGTADTMEVLTQVNLTPETMRDVVSKHHACLAWGGTARLAPADDVLISVERPLGIDSQGQMIASILSKKLAAGSTHLLVDIPVGPSAKVRHMQEALQLRKLFEYIGDRMGIHLEVIITDGSQPVGNGIGPVLEARDVMQVLQNDPAAPADLRQKSLRLAGRILEFDPDVRGGYGYSIARDILESGRALEKMQDIINAQGAKKDIQEPGKHCFEINAENSGVVTHIDSYHLAKLARLAGAPIDKGAGIDLLKKLGDEVSKGEPLYRVHTEYQSEFRFAQGFTENTTGYLIGKPEEVSKTYMEF